MTEWPMLIQSILMYVGLITSFFIACLTIVAFGGFITKGLELFRESTLWHTRFKKPKEGTDE